MQSTYSDLSGDYVKALEFLALDSKVDSRRIGFWGGSQGFWIAALAALKSSRAKFTILVSGAALSPIKQDDYRAVEIAKKRNFSSKEVQLVKSTYEIFVKYSQGFLSYDSLKAYFDKIDSRRVREVVVKGGVLPPEDHPILKESKLNGMFDPLPILRNLKIPTLLVYGLKDSLGPVKESVAVYKNIFNDSGHSDFTVHVYENGDHGIYDVTSKSRRKLVSKYKTDLATWLESQ